MNVLSSLACASAMEVPTAPTNEPNAGPPFSSSSVMSDCAAAPRRPLLPSGKIPDLVEVATSLSLAKATVVASCSALAFVGLLPLETRADGFPFSDAARDDLVVVRARDEVFVDSAIDVPLLELG